VAGIDEAGRGPWAGPVCASAVVFYPEPVLSGLLPCIEQINDSKKLSPALREDIFDFLSDSGDVEIGVALVDVDEIDRINILQATRRAMRTALDQLAEESELVLVDGRPLKDLHPRAEFMVKGDSKSLSIAAASIVAKVTRDRYMLQLDAEYPEYGFARHKGYGTKAHAEALLRHGPCRHHRRSFKPVAALLGREPEL
jgi:ribonuclease HII